MMEIGFPWATLLGIETSGWDDFGPFRRLDERGVVEVWAACFLKLR